MAQWAFEHRRPAGLGTDTLPGTEGVYFPMKGAAGVIGVLANGRRFTNESESYHDVGAAMIKACAGQRVDVRRLQHRVAIAAQMVGTVLVGDEQHKARSALHRVPLWPAVPQSALIFNSRAN